jgi:hypothetical protein
MKQIYLTAILFLTLSLKAQIVPIPDNNFKNKLIQLGVDTNNDDLIQVSEASAVETLNLGNSNISSLEGIRNFTTLKNLYCQNNTIINLDVSGMTSLMRLDCSYNQITILNIQNLPNLSFLNCSFNLVTQIDASSTGASEFNFSNNPNLTYVNIQNNYFTPCITFPTAGYDYTCIMFLDCPQLRTVCLDAIETSVFFSQAPQANVVFATTNCALGLLETSGLHSLKLYPNPAENLLYLETDKLLINKQIYLYNMLGQLIYSKTTPLSDNLSSINISSLPKGNYIISIITDEGKVSKKFTKL